MWRDRSVFFRFGLCVTFNNFCFLHGFHSIQLHIYSTHDKPQMERVDFRIRFGSFTILRISNGFRRKCSTTRYPNKMEWKMRTETLKRKRGDTRKNKQTLDWENYSKQRSKIIQWNTAEKIRNEAILTSGSIQGCQITFLFHIKLSSSGFAFEMLCPNQAQPTQEPFQIRFVDVKNQSEFQLQLDFWHLNSYSNKMFD